MDDRFVYSRPLGQLPNNDKIYVLTSIGEVSYDFGPTEPVWVIKFSQFEKGKLLVENGFSIKLGGTVIKAAIIGSVWRKRRNIGFVNKPVMQEIYLDLPVQVTDQKVVYRIEQSKHSENVFSRRYVPDSKPYILIGLLGDEHVNFALISSFEVFRYYYAYLGSVCRHFFSFDADGNNERLFNAASTRWHEKDSYYIFDPTPNITDADQKRMAHYLVSKVARKAIGLTAASARAQASRKEKVYPVCRVPISGVNKWKVSGQFITIQVSGDQEASHLQVIAISSLDSCYDRPRVFDVRSMRERTIWKTKKTDDNDDDGDNDRKNKKFRPPTLTDETIPVISDKPFGNPVVVNNRNSGNKDGNRVCWDEVDFIRIGQENKIELPYRNNSDNPLPDEVTTKNEGGGPPNTGRVSDDSLPHSEPKLKTVPITEEKYRRGLEHIFTFKSPGEISTDELSLSELPESLTYLFHSATQYFQQNPDISGCFLGGDSKVFYEDVVPVFVLDPDWGQNTRCRAAKNGVRRALVLELPTPYGNVYFFDLEKKKNEKIGIHFMYFSGRSLSVDQIASILYRRLEGKTNRGWPKRKQYAGDFWSASLYHYGTISPEDTGAQIKNAILQMSGG